MKKPLMLVIRHTYEEWHNYMKRMAAEVGVSDSYQNILTYLNHHPGASQKDIAKYRGITPSSVNQTVSEMLVNGYLEKIFDESDQRLSHLYLTGKGTAYADALRDRLHCADDQITLLVSPDKEKEIIELMEMLAEQFRKGLPKC